MVPEQSAIEAFRLGAKDYLIEPFTVDEVVETIDRSLVETRLLHDKAELAEQLRRVKVEMSRQTHEMNTLFKIGKAITSLLSVDQVLERVQEAAKYLTDGEDSRIWLMDEAGTQLRAFEKPGDDAEDKNFTAIVEGESYLSEVVRQGRPFRQSRFTENGLKVKTGLFARAILCVPLKTSRRCHWRSGCQQSVGPTFLQQA
ncbi:MAG: hypothetical protein IPH82_26320 [Chloroflexi bacterium]|nr:hypothetical protein [Chloroflexota bacterium]